MLLDFIKILANLAEFKFYPLCYENNMVAGIKRYNSSTLFIYATHDIIMEKLLSDISEYSRNLKKNDVNDVKF